MAINVVSQVGWYHLSYNTGMQPWSFVWAEAEGGRVSCTAAVGEGQSGSEPGAPWPLLRPGGISVVHCMRWGEESHGGRGGRQGGAHG